MQTELPTMLNVFDTDYQLEYSESFTGNLHQETAIEGYAYCTSLQTAFQSLMSENYTNFILTIGSSAVAIYRHSNNTFKVFDSHARNLCGNSYSQGTCVLLELASLSYLVHYFQSVHYNVIFELKGLQINEVHNNIQTDNIQTEDCSHEYTTFNQSYAVAIYSLCYSLIKPCGYWNAKTLSNIVDGGKHLCTNMSLNKYVTADELPKAVNMCVKKVKLAFCNNTGIHGVLLDTYESKVIVIDNIKNNYSENTGFVMSFSSYSISCIFKPTKRSKYMYCLVVYNETKSYQAEYIKNINCTDSLVDEIINIHHKYQSTEHENYYKIQFFACSSEIVEQNERKRLMKNHRQRQSYDAMEPLKKKILLEKSRSINTTNKQELQRKRSQ